MVQIASAPLRLFHPLVRTWFGEEVGDPTEVQRLAWPHIAAGEHVLATAPTGSGKTLAAFLWAIDRLLTGAWDNGRVRVLYVSPMRALNTDVRRNLLAPLAALEARFRAAGVAYPEVRVLTRSGDTPQEERQRMARRPPEILITTPESLNILLTSRRGREMLGGVACVVLDEVHAIAASKRGALLGLAVERIVREAGELQRIALSATVKPLEHVAAWVGGQELFETADGISHRRRPVAIVEARTRKRLALQIRFPAARLAGSGAEEIESAHLWDALVDDVTHAVRGNTSTLVFANSRRMVEKLARLLNEAAGDELTWSHHGSLAREVRSEVEEKLKAGQLRSIVATNSLELGIDIGAVDEVVLVHTPPTVASAVQRVGRSGHQVGAVSRGTFIPLFGRDLLQATVVARAVADGAIEDVRPLAGALDVLAQAIVSMTASEGWPIDALFATVRGADAFRDVTRRQFDLVLAMLSGRYTEVRLRELQPIVTVDLVEGVVRGRPGAERLVYLAGGTIPDRGYFHLRREDSRALLGELDEEFVWERSVGDTFTLGVQSWRIAQITHNDVLVTPARGRGAMAPFWRADERDRPWALQERVGRFMAAFEERLDDPTLAPELERDWFLDPPSAAALIGLLRRQRAATGRLPHRHRVVVEHVVDPQQRGPGGDLVLHTFWGGQVNRPFALAVQAAARETHGRDLDVQHDDDCVIIAGAAADVDVDELFALVHPGSVERLLRARLEQTGFFGARFRAAAACSLLLPRAGFARRTPLWLSRQRAKDLFAAVRTFDDFPLLLETWRTCLADDLDLEALTALLGEVADGRIELWHARTERPSPLAAGVTWRRTNALMYEDDAAAATGPSRLRTDLLREVAFTPHLRPRLRRDTVDAVVRKLRRLAPGYAPRGANELFDWVIERGAVPAAEWAELRAAIARDTGGDVGQWLASLSGKITVLSRGDTDGEGLVVATQDVPRFAAALDLDRTTVDLRRPGDTATVDRVAEASLVRLAAEEPSADESPDPLAEILADQLRFSGPLAPAQLAATLGLELARCASAIEVLADAGRVVSGELFADATETVVCDLENFERLLRVQRAAARPSLEPLPPSKLPLFLATWHGLGTVGAARDAFEHALERLFGLPMPASAWEQDVLPARLDPYLPAWLDSALAESGLAWFGCGPARIAFAFPADRELFVDAEAPAAAEDLLPPGPGRYSLDEISRLAGCSSAEAARRVWAAAWRGEVTNDTFAAVRRGIENDFSPAEAVSDRHGARSTGRRRFDRWQSSRPFLGAWSRVAAVEPPVDALAADALGRDRARLVLQRHGVVFRELLEREAAPLRWGQVFRALRLLELGGEAVTGQFVAGVAGLQFALPAAVRILQEGLAEDRVFWHSAIDPVSPCSLGIEGLPPVPRRVAGNFLVWHGGRLVLVVERRGAALSFAVAPDDDRLPDYLTVLKVLITRQVAPLKAVSVATINGQDAASSPYRVALGRIFDVVRDGRSVRLLRRYLPPG